jgi:hypothetical protein
MEIKALGANIARVRTALAHAHRGSAASRRLRDRVFLNDDRISSDRQRSAGENAYGLSGSNAAGKGMPRRCGADHSEGGRQPSDIGGAHGIAVHGGGIERRLGQQRGQRLGQRAPVRRLHGGKFDGRRLDAIEDAL